MGKPLTLDLVLSRSKADRLGDVRNLNLWGNDIEDVSILKELTNVEVLSLSVNKIASLRDFQYCAKLTELYLRKNLVSDLTEIRYLQNLQALKVLWLWDNPCAETQNYRSYVIKSLPNLAKLDNQPVTPEERKALGPSEEPTRTPATNIAPAKIISEPPPKREAPSRSIEVANPRPSSQERVPKVSRVEDRPADSRSQNILCAVLALLKELDISGIEIIKQEVDRRLGSS